MKEPTVKDLGDFLDKVINENTPSRDAYEKIIAKDGVEVLELWVD